MVFYTTKSAANAVYARKKLYIFLAFASHRRDRTQIAYSFIFNMMTNIKFSTHRLTTFINTGHMGI